MRPQREANAVERLISVAGLFILVGIAWALSENRKAAPWRLVVLGLVLQVVLALLVLRTGFGAAFFEAIREAFDVIREASLQGSRFVFGALTDVIVLEPDAVVGAEEPVLINAVVGFQVLPIIIFVSTAAGMLYHLGVLQAVVRAMAWLMRRTLKTSGAETFATAALVFMGIEAMPAIKAYLRDMTRSELCTIMTAFMSTVAASVLVLYASFGAEPGHLLAASIMSAPAAIVVAKLLVPETQKPKTAGDEWIRVEVESHNVMDGAARGASDGVMLAVNVGALLIAFVSLIYVVNRACFAVIGITFSELAGYLFVPFAVLMGVPLEDAPSVGQLLGTKTIVNELVAYTELQAMIAEGALQPRSITIATYALCGFANPGSLGILLAGLVGLAPERRHEITQLGVKSFIGGTLAVFMTAAIAGILV